MKSHAGILLLFTLAMPSLAQVALPTALPKTSTEAAQRTIAMDDQIRTLEEQLKLNPTFKAWQRLKEERQQMSNLADTMRVSEDEAASRAAHQAAIDAALKKAQQNPPK
jgi:hypothetical protein